MRLFASLLVAVFVIGLAYTQQPPANHYVSPALCARCHQDIAVKYRQTGMGRSFYRAPADLTTAKPFYHAASDNYFAMTARGGKVYQRRWQIGFDGQETNIDERQVDFVLGSGNHSRTYLHLTARNTLQQLPLAWYAEKGGSWGMNPGYDKPDFPGPTRQAGYQCMFCHNAYPTVPAGHAEEGAEAQYTLPLPEGIDCQRCHGPGERHIAAAGRAGAQPAEIRSAIVNPAKLSAERELEVCLECHLETSAQKLPHSVERHNRGPFSYVPGQPLADFRLSFDRVAPDDRLEVAHAGYRLLQSQCFRKSGGTLAGKLRCTTCHDPHNEVEPAASATRYNRVCLTCHQEALGRAVASGAHTAEATCTACHMPRRRTDESVHIVMTDHQIRRRPPAGDLLAEKDVLIETPATPYRGEVVPYYPAQLPSTPENALDVAVAQIRDRSNLEKGLPRLAALLAQYRPQAAGYYADLAEAYQARGAAGDNARIVQYFDLAVQHAPSSPAIALRYANALIESRQWARADTLLRNASPRTAEDPALWGLWGEALRQQNKNIEARSAFEKGLSLDADAPDVHYSLGLVLVGMRDWPEAEKEYREALRISPGIAEWRASLANLLASLDRLPEAQYQFELSIRLKPAYAGSHLGYARLLANTNRIPDAVKQAQAAVEADPQSAAGHQLWGDLLAAQGDWDGAARELQTAVGLAPNLWAAQYDLGAVLAQKGDTVAAIGHLKIAAAGADSAAKASALELLQKLGR